MQVNYEIVELFPTPIYTAMIPPAFSKVVSFFDKQDMGTDSDHDNYGYRSKDSYLLDKPECKELAEYILSSAKVYGDQLGYDYERYRFGQSWISVKAPGQHHTMHTHPNGLISGVLYYGPVGEKTPAIKFHKMTAGVNVSYIQPKIADKKRKIKYAQSEFSVMFEPGLLLLFPSYLHHSVPINKTDKLRHSLAFNVIPLKGFGDERNLTELIF